MNSVVIKDYNKNNRFYLYDLDRRGPLTSAAVGDARKNPAGHVIIEDKKKPEFLGLFCQNEKIWFAGLDCLFDVTSDSWHAESLKDGILHSKFKLLDGNRVKIEKRYFEFARTEPGDLDAHFFADTAHWLRSNESKKNLLKYWSGSDAAAQG